MRESINKTTVIIVLALFLSVSVGYALFGDTITIEGTATAQGNFDIEATCLTNISDELNNVIEYPIGTIVNSIGEGYSNESCFVVDDKMSYSVSLEYPGAYKIYGVKLKNIGTIDGAVSAADFVPAFENNTINVYNAANDTIVRTETGSDKFFNIYGNAVQNANNVYKSMDNLTEDELNYFFNFENEENPSYILRVGASWYWLFKAQWPTEGYSEDGVYYEAKQTIEFPFTQYNK